MTPAAPVDLEAEFVGLAAALRRHGMIVPVTAVQAAMTALAALGEPGRDAVYASGRLAFCRSPDDLATFDRAFALWFGDRSWAADVRTASQVPVIRDRAVLGDAEGTSEEAALAPPTASRTELLRRRDLRDLDPADRARADRMVARLRSRPPTRRSRRSQRSSRGDLDLRAVTAEALRTGGEPLSWPRRAPRRRARRTVVLVDVSGSMSEYADTYVLFAYAVCRAIRGAEAFAVGTRLTPLTRALRSGDPQSALVKVSGQVDDWAGGTRLGDQLKVFLDRWGQRGLARGATVVVFSDGWERGGAEALAAQSARLARLAHRVVWCHPHQARPGYEPLTAGMQAVLPHIDALVAGHSVEALERVLQLIEDPTPQTLPPLR